MNLINRSTFDLRKILTLFIASLESDRENAMQHMKRHNTLVYQKTFQYLFVKATKNKFGTMEVKQFDCGMYQRINRVNAKATRWSVYLQRTARVRLRIEYQARA